MKSLFLFTVVLLVGCSKGGPTPPVRAMRGGDEVGNGGDFIRILMEEGKVYASQAVMRIRPDAFPANIGDYLEKEELSWLLKHQGKIEEDIRLSQYVWRDRLPEGCPPDECACAFQGERLVYFNQTQCEAKLNKRQEAAKLLIHEAMHHFVGSDEAKAKRLGVALYAAWYNMGHPDSAHWKFFTPSKRFKGVTVSAWRGKELVVWGETQRSDARAPSFQVGYFNPATGRWRFETTTNFYTKNRGEAAPYQSPLMAPQWVGGQAYLVSDFSNGDAANPAFGRRYHEASRTWHSIAEFPAKINERAVSRHWRDLYLGVVGKKILAWNVSPADGDPDRTALGFLYDPVTNAWTPVSREGAPQYGPGGYAAQWVNDRLLVWSPPTLSSYDPAKDRWANLPIATFLHFRYRPSLLWTGQEILIYGGANLLDYDNSGAAFLPKSSRWREISKGPVHEGIYTRGPCLWTGTEALFLQDAKVVAYDPFHDKWVSQTESYPETLVRDGTVDWTGMEMIGWDNHTKNGYLFYP